MTRSNLRSRRLLEPVKGVRLDDFVPARSHGRIRCVKGEVSLVRRPGHAR